MNRRAMLVLSGATLLALKTNFAWAAGKKIKVVAVYDSPVQLKWINVLHRVLVQRQKEGVIDYSFSESVPMADYIRTLRNAAAEGPDLVIGASFGYPQEARRVAAEFPAVNFLMGDAGAPSGKNFSVFDNWNQEGAYLMGMLAGAMSKSGKIGMVGGYPIPDVTRPFNAFIAGARRTRADAQFKVAFTGSWFDPPKEKEFAFAQFDAGVDAIFAERAGVVPAAKERSVLGFGIINDMNQEDGGKDVIVTSALWNMQAAIDRAIQGTADGSFNGEDYRPYSEMAHGGTALAPYYEFDSRIPDDLKQQVIDVQKQIISGEFVVDIDPSEPKSTF